MKNEITIVWKATGAVAHQFETLKEASVWYASKDSSGVFDLPLAVDERDVLIAGVEVESLVELALQ